MNDETSANEFESDRFNLLLKTINYATDLKKRRIWKEILNFNMKFSANFI